MVGCHVPERDILESDRPASPVTASKVIKSLNQRLELEVRASNDWLSTGTTNSLHAETVQQCFLHPLRDQSPPIIAICSWAAVAVHLQSVSLPHRGSVSICPFSIPLQPAHSRFVFQIVARSPDQNCTSY